MGVLDTLRPPSRVPRDTSMNHPLAGAISQGGQGGHARSLKGPHQPPEGQSYAFSFILVGMKNDIKHTVAKFDFWSINLNLNFSRKIHIIDPAIFHFWTKNGLLPKCAK